MKVSIVTISFNQAQFLEEAICSVIDQDYADIEYIVVDPGSTDGSRDIIERYRNRIAKIIHKGDSGPAEGLNNGFAEATGDIFGFLNADDLLEPVAVTKVVQYLSEHPKIDVVSGHSWIIDAEGNRRRRFFSDRYSLKMAAYGASILSQPSTYFRAEAFQRVGGFNVANRSNWDGELFVDLALSGARFKVFSEFLSCYRVHGEGITGSGKLHLLHKQHQERMFGKVMRRIPSAIDPFVFFLAKFLRKILNPFDTFERLRFGAIYRSTR